MNVTIPSDLIVFVPALDRNVTVSTNGVTGEEIVAMLLHGLKQKLTDSAAGKPDKAEELVAKRLATVWDASGNRGPKADPIMVEARVIVLKNAEKLKLQKKSIPAKISEFSTWLGSGVIEQRLVDAIVSKAEQNVAEREIPDLEA